MSIAPRGVGVAHHADERSDRIRQLVRHDEDRFHLGVEVQASEDGTVDRDMSPRAGWSECVARSVRVCAQSVTASSMRAAIRSRTSAGNVTVA